jgi:hypothetical protein
MKQYTVYNKEGKVLLSTFDEDKAWVFFDPREGHTIDESVDDDGGYDEYKEGLGGDTNLAFKYQ